MSGLQKQTKKTIISFLLMYRKYSSSITFKATPFLNKFKSILQKSIIFLNNQSDVHQVF